MKERNDMADNLNTVFRIQSNNGQSLRVVEVTFGGTTCFTLLRSLLKSQILKQTKNCSHSSPWAMSSERLGVQFVLSFSLYCQEDGSVNNAQHHGGIPP